MTLLEVLVSLAIFALAVICLGVAYVNTIGALQAVAEMEKEAGDWRAVRRLLLSEPDRTRVTRGGTMQLPDGHRITWGVEISPANVMDLFEVRLSGRRTTVQGAEQIHEETFRVLRPTWSEPAERERLLEAAKGRRTKRTAS